MTDDTPRLCFSYLRFSRAEQAKGSSTKRQTDLREAYCQRHNLVLDTSRMITDEGISAYNGHNSVEGNLAEFLDLVKGGSVPRGSVLLIESIDRLSRDQIIPARNLLESILLAGIDVHTLQPERIYTSKSLEDVQSLILMILEFSRAHDYSQQLGNRISAAWSSKREKAKTNQTPLSKCPPAWLRVVDGKYEVRAVGRKDPKIVPYLQDQSNGNSYPLSYFEFYMLGWLVKFEPEPTKKQSNSEITALEEKIAKLDYKIQTLKDKINSGEEFESFLELLATAEKERKDQSQKLEQLRAITPVGQGLVTMQGLFERLSRKDSNDHADHTNRKTNLDPADYTNRETNLELRATLRRMVKQIEVTIGQEHRFWPKKSLRASITFRDGNRAEFMHKF